MCGRFTETATPKKIAVEFKVPIAKVPDVKPSYNVSPSQPVRALVQDNKDRRIELMNWGFVPSWAKDPAIGNRMINARCETLAEKPSFRGPFKNNRCLVIADGFYEWKREGKFKQPYYIRLKSHDSFGFAGLWSRWISPDGSEIISCTVITTGPNDLMEPIHNRMPVIVPPDLRDEWLDHSSYEEARLLGMLKPYQVCEMECYPISKMVNLPSNNEPACVIPASL